MATSFTVTMTGDQEATATGPAPTGSTATGTGTVTWDTATDTATYEIVVTGLDFGPVTGQTATTPDVAEDDVTNMHVHNAARDTAGPVVFGQIAPGHDEDDLEVMTVTPNGDGSWTISGSWEPTDTGPVINGAEVSITDFAEALDAAAAGEDVPLYFNVHTEPFPAGEIRGQWVAADGGEEPPPTEPPPTEPPPTEPPPNGAVDWDALAAVVLANFAATGQWFPGQESQLPPDPVDWDAVAAEVTANFEATGQWFL